MAGGRSLQDLFEQASGLPSELREDWLVRNVPAGEQRERLLALLRADADTGSILDRPAPWPGEPERAADEEGLAAHSLVGRTLGPYRLEELIGQGGSSAVYRATREVGGFRQSVALKLLRRGLHAEAEHRLFRREQRFLARLEHPDIARLIDGGVSPEGIPYLVVELVEGEPVTRHCERLGLPLAARLALFVRLARAVEAAHRALVVHRDLKPENVLVRPDGELRVLDFGIAKLLDEDDGTASVTASGRMTPGYAAPEQLAGGAITVATDVFALGVLLAELALGRRPRRSELEAPALVQAGLQPRELAHVVGQACAPEPERRYPGVAALREDVERFLAGQPVRAHPPSVGYRLRKFVERHRAAVAATVVAAAALLAATVVSSVEAARANRAAKTSRAVQDFLVGLFEDAAAQVPRGEMPTTRQLLDFGVARAASDFGGEPAVAVELLRRFAQSYLALDLTDRAEAISAEQLARARAHFGDESLEAALAHLERGRVAFVKSDFGTAERELRRARELVLTEAPDGVERAEVDSQLGSLLITTARHEEGIALATSGARIFERECRRSDRVELCRNAVVTDYGIGVALGARGRTEEAIARLEPVVERARVVLATDRRVVLARMINGLGSHYQRLGRFERAEALSREALAMALETGEAGEEAVLECRTELAAALSARGDLAGAAAELGEIVAALDRRHPAGHRLSASHRVNRAIYLVDLGELDTAQVELERALAWFRGEQPPARPWEARALELVARVRAGQGLPEAALEAARRAVELRREEGAAAALGSALMTLARIQLDAGAAAEAAAAAREGYRRSVEGLGEDHPLQALRGARLAEALAAAGETEAAAEALERAERRALERYPDGHPNRCRIALSGARLAARAGRIEEARARARAACDRFLGAFSPRSELVRDYRALTGAGPAPAPFAAARFASGGR
jgi:serine/threonine-protein kinase